jgi:hypothetical protein
VDAEKVVEAEAVTVTEPEVQKAVQDVSEEEKQRPKARKVGTSEIM